MADELDYLQPSFEPSSVTMPKLRNILMTNDIPYPASAKKGELVDIFNQHLKPKARRILAARDRVRRTSEGITYVPSSQESSTSGDLDDRNSMPPPPIPPTPRQRKSKKAGRPESEERNLTSSDRRTPSTGRNASNKHGRQSDTEPEADISRPAARKSRKSEITPKTRVDQPASASRPKMPEGVFSNDNPFQRGSPPSDATDHRRRTAGASVDKRKSSSSRRRTEGALPRNPSLEQSDGAVVPSSKTFEVPVSRLRGKQPKKDSHGEIEAGEEFTPEAQLELDNEQDLSGGQDVTTSRKRKATHTHATVPKSIPWLVVATLLGGYATWYRQEKLAVGYCGIGRPSVTVSNVHIPDWADVFRPACELCPQHATCYENLDTECSDGFILRDHPFSLGGLVPLPPTCEPDGEKARKVKAVADRGVNYLRDRNAQAVCGTLKDSEGNHEPQAIPERQLKEAVKQQKRKGMSESEFDNIWKGAFEEIIGREEVSHEQSAQGVRLTSKSLARVPFGCGIKLSARLTLARHRVSISLIFGFCMIAAYVRNRILQSRQDRAKIPSLVATTLDRLATQAALFSRGDAHESWISVGQLRDDVLRDEFSDRRREGLWKKVRDVVEKNANVRASSRELRGGDVSRVWEWIGSLGLNDDPGFSGRKSGGKRVSWGGVMADPNEKGVDGRLSPIKDEEGSTDRAKAKGGEQRRWDEGRPIY